MMAGWWRFLSSLREGFFAAGGAVEWDSDAAGVLLGRKEWCGEMRETGERWPRVGESGHEVPRGDTIASASVGWCWGWWCAAAVSGRGSWDWLREANQSTRGGRGKRGMSRGWFLFGCWDIRFLFGDAGDSFSSVAIF